MQNTSNDKWIYTYSYAPEQTWEVWRTSKQPPNWIAEECQNIQERISKLDTVNAIRFILLTDSHYTINGTWEDTFYSLHSLHSLIKLDGVIHLGDLTDGMLNIQRTQELENIVKNHMLSLNIPVYIAAGNHDYNYFKGNKDLIYPEKPQFYVDYHQQKLRLIFIDSFDPKESYRYGFTDYCIHWLEAALHSLPNGYCVIVFSHVPPLVRLQAWTKEIRGRVLLMDVLNQYADKILAYINGHNHCDHLFNDLYNGKFPIISINCAKCEYFTSHKPEGAVVPYRQLGKRTQESFDIMTIDTNKREIYFTRFGAGQDRKVTRGKAEWI